MEDPSADGVWPAQTGASIRAPVDDAPWAAVWVAERALPLEQAVGSAREVTEPR